jgi:hypothetical protein
MDKEPHVLTPEQASKVADRLAKEIAAEEDVEFFRGVLEVTLSGMWSCDAANFAKRLLEASK